MIPSRKALHQRLLRFLKAPISEKMHALEGTYYRLKGGLYYRRIFANFGNGALLIRPTHITNLQCITVGDRTTIGHSAVMQPIVEYASVRYSPKIDIGKDVYIGPHAYLASIGNLTIGDGSVLSEYVYLNDAGHGFDPEGGLIMQQELVHPGDITIGKDCFLGIRSAIMPGVTLGDRCVVGAGSVVTKSFPAYSMVAGVPAALIKRYSFEEKKWVRAQ